MDRISDPTKQADKFGSGKHGYTEGTPGVTPPSKIRATAMDGPQEEIVRVIEDAGLTPTNSDLGQLLQAIKPQVASYEISGTAKANNALMDLTADFADPIYALASNVVTVSQAGYYRVKANLQFTDSSTANPISGGFYFLINSSDSYQFWGTRFSASNSDKTQAFGEIFVLLDAGDTIEVYANATSAISTSATSTLHSKLLVERLRRV
jgi:hypothetical protein